MALLKKYLSAAFTWLWKHDWVEIPVDAVTEETPSDNAKNGTRTVTLLSKAEQLAKVQQSNLGRCPLLNQGEQEAFVAVSSFVRSLRDCHHFRFSTQVSMGEFLSNHSKQGKRIDGTAAFFAINSLRNDFCLLDENWMPIAVIEYNGTGHFGSPKNQHKFNKAITNAEIKRAACEKAGILYHEIPLSKTTKEQILAHLNQYLRPLLCPASLN